MGKASNVFTVHTPVAAGNDEFPVEMMDKYFSHYFGKLGINREQFLALGRLHPKDDRESFKMPVLAISDKCVSKWCQPVAWGCFTDDLVGHVAGTAGQ